VRGGTRTERMRPAEDAGRGVQVEQKLHEVWLQRGEGGEAKIGATVVRVRREATVEVAAEAAGGGERRANRRVGDWKIAMTERLRAAHFWGGEEGGGGSP
jgi:hypothetical protein